jgi:hypothetical protein
MKDAVKKRLRCAVYTRKSTEHNLGLEFNSLDAQREACEAFSSSGVGPLAFYHSVSYSLLVSTEAGCDFSS